MVSGLGGELGPIAGWEGRVVSERRWWLSTKGWHPRTLRPCQQEGEDPLGQWGEGGAGTVCPLTLR